MASIGWIQIKLTYEYLNLNETSFQSADQSQWVDQPLSLKKASAAFIS